MANLAQLVELRFVVPAVVSSSLIVRPNVAPILFGAFFYEIILYNNMENLTLLKMQVNYITYCMHICGAEMKAILNEKNIKNDAKSPNVIDIHVGRRIRLRRNILGISQKNMAELLGITFQQVQKYENAENRVGASRLYDFSRILKVPVQFFFEDIDKDTDEQSPRMLVLHPNATPYFAEEVENIDLDPMKRMETLELVNAYYKIRNRTVAKQLLELVVKMSENNDSDVNKNE